MWLAIGIVGGVVLGGILGTLYAGDPVVFLVFIFWGTWLGGMLGGYLYERGRKRRAD